jgi:hypothetical protein
MGRPGPYDMTIEAVRAIEDYSDATAGDGKRLADLRHIAKSQPSVRYFTHH